MRLTILDSDKFEVNWSFQGREEREITGVNLHVAEVNLGKGGINRALVDANGNAVPLVVDRVYIFLS